MTHILENSSSLRAMTVCGERVKHYRKMLGWTQEELAHHSGYSDRLIRKAEASRTLSVETVQNLAQSLSCEHFHVTPEDLTWSPKKSLQRFLEFGRCEEKDVQLIPRVITDDCRLDFMGDARFVLTGTWIGYEGIVRWLSLFHQHFLDKEQVEESVVAVDGVHGFVQWQLSQQSGELPLESVHFVMCARFRACKISQVSIISDSHRLESFEQTSLA